MEHVLKVTASFVGRNGSCGYIKGVVYDLKVVNTIRLGNSQAVAITPIDYAPRHILDRVRNNISKPSRVIYDSMDLFKENWLVHSVESIGYYEI